jgi:hypothetical protein
LWIDVNAVFKGDVPRSQRVMNKGLKSPQHAAFVKRLKKAEAAKRSTRRRT